MNLAELQQSLFDRLTSAVGGSFVGIYSEAPQADDSENPDAFPYITLGPFPAIPFDTKTDNGGEVAAQVHLWTREPGKASRALHDQVYNALQKYALPMVGANVIDCRFDGSDDFKDPDGLTLHIVMRWRVLYDLT